MNNILSQLSIDSLEELITEIQVELLKRRDILQDISSTSVCGNTECKCFFTHKGELNGTPEFDDTKLVVWNLDGNDEHLIRKQLLEVIRPFSTSNKIFVRGSFANLTFKNHIIATNVQHKLDENGYKVNFYCSNMKDIK
jgi:hypothetical protein